MNKTNLHEVNYQLNSTTYKNRLSRIPRILDSGANIIAIHPEDSMTMIPTHTALQASKTTGAIMESTSEARLTFRHKRKNVPEEFFKDMFSRPWQDTQSWAWASYVIMGVC